MGNDADFAELREVGDQLVGHAVSEILLLRIAREVVEWQHRQRLNPTLAEHGPDPFAYLPEVRCRDKGKCRCRRYQGRYQEEGEHMARCLPSRLWMQW